MAKVFLRERGGEGKNLYKTWRLNLAKFRQLGAEEEAAIFAIK